MLFPSIILKEPLRLPVEVISVKGKVRAGTIIPIIALNITLNEPPVPTGRERGLQTQQFFLNQGVFYPSLEGKNWGENLLEPICPNLRSLNLIKSTGYD